MTLTGLLEELRLNGKALSILLADAPAGTLNPRGGSCTLANLNRALSGETICFDGADFACRGALRGFGFADGVPDIPGGFGNFIAHGAGAGFPPGEHIKCSAALGEAMLNAQPADVLGGCRYVVVKPCDEADDATLAAFLCNADQLSALVHLFNYRRAEYDSVIAPMVSGCASVFRIPLAESRTPAPRAVIGNVDVFSRPHFPAGTFWLTIPFASLLQILADAENTVLTSHIWRGVKARLQT